MQRKFVFVTTTVIASFLLTELSVRLLFRYNTPDTVRENTLQYRAAVFGRHLFQRSQRVESEKAWGGDEGLEHSARLFVINDQGYRGREFQINKTEGTCRILVLGGSAVFDAPSEEGEDWPHLVEKILKEKEFNGVEVINAGVPGHAGSDSLGRLFAQLWVYDPDYVLFYNAWNDIKLWSRLSRSRPLIELVYPYDSKADPFRNYRNRLDWLLCRSQIYVKLRNRYYIWRVRPGSEGRRGKGKLSQSYSGIGPRQYRLTVELVVETARSMGATPILLTQATLVDAENTAEDRERIAYHWANLTHEPLLRAFRDCNDTVREVAQVRGVEILDLAAKLSGRSEFFLDHVHLSRAGGRSVAREVADFLSRRLAQCAVPVEQRGDE